MNKRMKRILALALVLILGLQLVACGSVASGKSPFSTVKENLEALREQRKGQVTDRETADTDTGRVDTPTEEPTTEATTEATTETTTETASNGLVGEWLCYKMDSSTKSVSEDDMKRLGDAGMYVYLIVKDDGTAQFYLFSTGYPLTWNDSAFGSADGSYYNSVPYNLDGDELEMYNDQSGDKMFFRRVNNIQSIINGNGDTEPEKEGVPTPSGTWEDHKLLTLSYAVPDNFVQDTELGEIDEANGYYNECWVLYDNENDKNVYNSIDVYVYDKSKETNPDGVAMLEEEYASSKDEDWEFSGFQDSNLDNVGAVRKAMAYTSKYNAGYEYVYLFEDDTYVYELVCGDYDELSNFRLTFEKKISK